MTIPPTIQRPAYGVADLKASLRATWTGWHLSEKADGICVRREFAGCSVWGDSMRDGRLMVWDLDRAFGADVRRLPWTERRAALDHLFARLPKKFNWHRCATGAGAEFIEAVLANGGEGVVAKPIDGKFGVDWVKVKRCETYDCIVTEKHPSKLSLHLALDGADAGWCPCLKQSNFDSVRAGDIVEIVAFGLHVSGKFREPRFLRVRHDKRVA